MRSDAGPFSPDAARINLRWLARNWIQITEGRTPSGSEERTMDAIRKALIAGADEDPCRSSETFQAFWKETTGATFQP